MTRLSRHSSESRVALFPPLPVRRPPPPPPPPADSSYTAGGHNRFLRLERHGARECHNIADGGEPRRVWIGFHQVEELTRGIEVEHWPQRHHSKGLLEARFSRVDRGPIAAKCYLRRGGHTNDRRGHSISVLDTQTYGLGGGRECKIQ